MNIPEWQLPVGVDRGLADYVRSEAMVAGYDAAMSESALARSDVAFCERHFPQPGRLIDLGTGTGRLCIHFAKRGYDCVGVDLSEVMLERALMNAGSESVSGGVEWKKANIVELDDFADNIFDYAACLFSTLGMVRGAEPRRRVVANAFRVLKPGGVFVLHVHNRWFRGLGWKRFRGANHAMPQAYGGAALTLHHFSKRETVGLLKAEGFAVNQVMPVGLAQESPGWWPYGYLLAATKASVEA